MPEPAFRVTGIDELQAALTRLSAEVRAQAVTDGMQAGGNVIRAGMQARAPRRTGALRSKIEVNVSVSGGAGIAKIGPIRDAFYGGILERGAKPHLIRATAFQAGRTGRLRRRGAKVLASATKVYGRVVEHPGVTARHWMTDALREDSPRAIEVMRGVILDHVEKSAADAKAKGR